MNKLKLLIIFLVILQGCNKDKALISNITLNGMNTNHSEVLNAVFIDNFWSCFPSSSFSSTAEFVFQTQESFQQFQQSMKLNASLCDTVSSPGINFDNYDLIGIITYGICRLTAERQVLADRSSRQYIYNIIIHTDQLPACKMLVSNMNWALVPKMPSGYTVQFNVVKVYS